MREAYRINAVILLVNGRTVADVADALLIDPETVRTYFKRYKKGGVDEILRMNYVGSEALLDEVQLAELDAHLQKHLHLTAESVAHWVKERWGEYLEREAEIMEELGLPRSKVVRAIQGRSSRMKKRKSR